VPLLVLAALVIAGQLLWNLFDRYEQRSYNKTPQQRRANAATREALSTHLANLETQEVEMRRQAADRAAVLRRRNRDAAIEGMVKPFALAFYALRAFTGREQREAERIIQWQAERALEESREAWSCWDE